MKQWGLVFHLWEFHGSWQCMQKEEQSLRIHLGRQSDGQLLEPGHKAESTVHLKEEATLEAKSWSLLERHQER